LPASPCGTLFQQIRRTALTPGTCGARVLATRATIDEGGQCCGDPHEDFGESTLFAFHPPQSETDAMKVVILAGGLGTRISEETHLKPKPMIEIGGKPILWHIMKMYSVHGVNEFVICCGYKGYLIKEYFANYFLHMSDVTFDMANNQMEVHEQHAEPWKVTLVDTGEDTLTGGRIKRVSAFIENEQAFCLTYGDGVSDVDIGASIEFHRRHGRWATVTAVQPPGRYGALERDGDRVTGFTEKPRGDGGYINGGFFVLSPKVLAEIEGDRSSWEGEPLTRIAAMGEMAAFEHHGFWQAMDTLRDKNALEAMWMSGNAPWKTWE
jgi:glucose-1-phosphate cytidylyltransferase